MGIRAIRAASPVALPLYGPPGSLSAAGGGQTEAGSSVTESGQKRPDWLIEA